MTHLGRGGSYITFTDTTVTKRVTDVWEPNYMRRWPEVFVPVLSIYPNLFDMPRYEQAVADDLVEAAPKLRALWNQPWVDHQLKWKPLLLTHLSNQNVGHGLGLKPIFIEDLVAALPTVEKPCRIHGDPTVANLVVGPDGPRWIDPLTRPYIPGDPHVDLGKMYQSCVGYEDVLLDRPVTVRFDLVQKLARELKLDLRAGLAWCRVHFVRLLPYQPVEERAKFLELLHAVPNHL